MLRIAIYFRKLLTPTTIEAELRQELSHAVDQCGDAVVGMFIDDGRLIGRGKYAAWHRLLGGLNAVDRVVIPSAGHLPGRTLSDLLRLLGTLRDHAVSLYLYREGIDTGHDSPFAVLDIIAAYRRAKRSEAIRVGQTRARHAGRLIGRPRIDGAVAAGIQAALRTGGGIRPTARRYGVSAGTVVRIRQSVLMGRDEQMD